MNDLKNTDGNKAGDHARRETENPSQLSNVGITRAGIDVALNNDSGHEKDERRQLHYDQYSKNEATSTATTFGTDTRAIKDADRNKNIKPKEVAVVTAEGQNWEGTSLTLPESSQLLEQRTNVKRQRKKRRRRKKSQNPALPKRLL